MRMLTVLQWGQSSTAKNCPGQHYSTERHWTKCGTRIQLSFVTHVHLSGFSGETEPAGHRLTYVNYIIISCLYNHYMYSLYVIINRRYTHIYTHTHIWKDRFILRSWLTPTESWQIWNRQGGLGTQERVDDATQVQGSLETEFLPLRGASVFPGKAFSLGRVTCFLKAYWFKCFTSKKHINATSRLMFAQAAQGYSLAGWIIQLTTMPCFEEVFSIFI